MSDDTDKRSINHLDFIRECPINSPLKIQGIKRKLLYFIYSNINWDRKGIWIEPFMGSGVVGFNGLHKKALMCDKNPHIISFFNAIKEKQITEKSVKEFLKRESQKLIAADENGKNNYYDEVRDRFNESHEPHDYLFLNRSCYNGLMRFNSHKKLNTPYGKNPGRFTASFINEIASRIYAISHILQKYNYTFRCQDWMKTIGEATKNDFIYFDPPYENLNNTYFEKWSEQDAINVYYATLYLDCNYSLSSWMKNQYGENEFIKKYYLYRKDVEFKFKEHNYIIGPKGVNRKGVTEILINKIQRGI